MLNIMRADFYRIRHSRSLLFWQLAILGFTAFATFSWGHDSKTTVTGWAAIAHINNSEGLFLWLLPLIMLVIGTDFSQHLLKDTLTMGVSRLRYFLSKMATMTIVLILQLWALQIVAFLAGSYFGGPGTINWGDWFSQMLVYVLLTLTEMTIITGKLYWSGSTTAALTGGTLALVLVSIMHFQFIHTPFFAYADWIMAVSDLPTVHLTTLGAVSKPVIGALVLVIGGGVLNAWRFEKMSL